MTYVRKNKTNRSFLKRIKISSKNKVTKRPAGQGHFNAKDSGVTGQKKKGDMTAPKELQKKVKFLVQR